MAPAKGELGKGTWLLVIEWRELSLNWHVRDKVFTPALPRALSLRPYAWKQFPNTLSEFAVREERDVTNHVFAEQKPSDTMAYEVQLSPNGTACF